MKLWLALIRAELLKLKRTLAFAMIFVAPAVVVALQVALLFNNKEGWGFDVDMWKFFFNSLASLWAIFMLPLFSALVVALLYHYEHANNGWLKLFALPVPKSMIIATKQIVALGIVLASMLVLLLATIAGGFVLTVLHPNMKFPTEIPWLTLLARSGLVFISAFALIAIQNWVSMRWSTLAVSLGVGIAGTFVALFASGWKYGHYYPWLIPVRVLNGQEQDWYATALFVGSVGGLVLFIAGLIDAARRERFN